MIGLSRIRRWFGYGSIVEEEPAADSEKVAEEQPDEQNDTEVNITVEQITIKTTGDDSDA